MQSTGMDCRDQMTHVARPFSNEAGIRCQKQPPLSPEPFPSQADLRQRPAVPHTATGREAQISLAIPAFYYPVTDIKTWGPLFRKRDTV